MTIEILLLGLASALRPTSFVAVVPLVRQHSALRLLAAFVIAGLVFTIALGAVVVWAFSGIEVGAGTDRTRAIAEIAAGSVALVFWALVVSGRISLRRLDGAPGASGVPGVERLGKRRITTRAAALAGPATHIPGLLYLIALDLIVAQEPGVAGGLAEIGLYNALWFAIPLVVLAVCVLEPDVARDGVLRLQRWAGLHARTLLLAMCFGLGSFLLVKGLLTL